MFLFTGDDRIRWCVSTQIFSVTPVVTTPYGSSLRRDTSETHWSTLNRRTEIVTVWRVNNYRTSNSYRWFSDGDTTHDSNIGSFSSSTLGSTS